MKVQDDKLAVETHAFSTNLSNFLKSKVMVIDNKPEFDDNQTDLEIVKMIGIFIPMLQISLWQNACMVYLLGRVRGSLRMRCFHCRHASSHAQYTNVMKIMHVSGVIDL